MKKIKNHQIEEALKQLLDSGEVVIGTIRVNDGENIAEYSALSACPLEYQDGYIRALETCTNAYICDVVYAPVFFAKQHAKTIATRE